MTLSVALQHRGFVDNLLEKCWHPGNNHERAMLSLLRGLVAVSALLLLAAPHQARADESNTYTTFLNDPNLRQDIINAAARSTVILQNPCAEAQYQVATKPVAFKAMTFDASGAPVSGLLKFPVKEEGCGITRILNVFVFARGPRQVGAIPFLPGSTRADPVLQKDAVRYAASWAVTAIGKNDECKVKYVANTEFVGQDEPSPGAKTAPWRELWTLVECNKKLTVPLHFVPDATGTQIFAGGAGARVEDLR